MGFLRSIANADYLDSYGNAANTVVFPLTVVAPSIAVMIGDGCCAFVSISLGSGNKDAAHKSIGSAVLLCITSGLVLTAIYLLLQEPILTPFGGRINDETFCQAKEYFFWITLGMSVSDLLTFAICGAVIVYTYQALDMDVSSYRSGRLPEPGLS